MQDGVSPAQSYVDNYSVNPGLVANNELDQNENPTGGYVRLVTEKDGADSFMALLINWQDGPRGQEDSDELLPPNGAFVEDVLWAAMQRLQFFEASKFKHEANDRAIVCIKQALDALQSRTKERSDRGVEGKHEV